jgi:hypothetical protein
MEQYLLWQKIEEAHRLGKREIMYMDGLEKIVLRISEPTPRTTDLMYG